MTKETLEKASALWKNIENVELAIKSGKFAYVEDDTYVPFNDYATSSILMLLTFQLTNLREEFDKL